MTDRLKKIRIVPLASESFGVRSMCTYVETSDVKVLLDPGASLAPNRFGLSPHPKEYEVMMKCRERISKSADKAEVVTISHYHFDHHTPSFKDWCHNWSSAKVARKIYGGKLLFIKNYRAMVNFSQRRRGWMFVNTGGRHAEKLEIADGRVFKFGDTELRFSDPVYHGPEDSALGWLLMTTIRCGDEKVLFASDVQGPMHYPTLEKIVAERPNLIIIGGPPIYLAGFRVIEKHLQDGMKNLKKVVKSVPVTVLEHHLLREERWKSYCQKIFDAASKRGHTVFTAAEFVGMKNNLLESRRKELFEAEPPSGGFKKWMKLPLPKRKLVRPPI